MSERRPYHRTQPRDWWLHGPYLAYTIRELTGVGVALYGGILLAGLICLCRGREAFDAYRQVMGGEVSLLVHSLLLAVMLWHVITWFQTMPKTMPKLVSRGRVVPRAQVVAAGLVLAFVCSAALLAGVVMVGALS